MCSELCSGDLTFFPPKITTVTAMLYRGIFLVVIALGAQTAAELSGCERLARFTSWQDKHTIVVTSSRMLTGTWQSEECETRPGPEYVLRSYTFDAEGVYVLIQHYYWDNSCSYPKLTVISHGRIHLKNSLIQPGASNGNAKPVNISVIPFDDKAVRELENSVSRECSGQQWKSWKRNEEHLVYDNKQERKAIYNLWSQSYQFSNNQRLNNPRGVSQTSGDISCLGPLKWAFNELKLVKIQLRPYNHENLKHMQMELLLGDIHSNKVRREFYSPTSFQLPLVRLTKGEEIMVSNQQYFIKSINALPMNLLSTNRKIPPHLIQQPNIPPHIWGKWMSTRCESRPMDVYLLRTFTFYQEDMVWVGEHNFYSDPFCTYEIFVVTAAGHFHIGGIDDKVKGAVDIDFNIEKATLTALDKRTISDMKLAGQCGAGEWKVNVPKELGPTHGCKHLGIFIPSIRYDILKVAIDYKGSVRLYLGQVDTNNLPTINYERPTAFQLPMVRCKAAHMISNSPEYAEQAFYFSNARRVNVNSILFVTALINLYKSVTI